MGKVYMSGGSGGGGAASDECTATAGDVLKGKTYIGSDTDDELGTGTLALSGNADVGDVIASKTFYTTDPKSKKTGTLALTGNAVAGDALAGKTFYSTDPKTKITGTITSKAAATYNALATDQTIGAGVYLSGDLTIKGVTQTGIAAENVRTGVKVAVNNGAKDLYAVTGTYTGVGNATAADVRAGKTFSTATLSGATGTIQNYTGSYSVTPGSASTTLMTANKYMTQNVTVAAGITKWG